MLFLFFYILHYKLKRFVITLTAELMTDDLDSFRIDLLFARVDIFLILP